MSNPTEGRRVDVAGGKYSIVLYDPPYDDERPPMRFLRHGESWPVMNDPVSGDHHKNYVRALAEELWEARNPPAFVEVVFNEMPNPNGARFVELEDQDGRSIKLGRWHNHHGGLVALRLPCVAPSPTAKPEPEHVAADGTVRKSHYGSGRQPWDDIVDAGWAAQFAAGNVLKYVKRAAAKNGEDDLKKARWYHDQLAEMCQRHESDAVYAMGRLKGKLLTTEEINLLASVEQS